LSDDVVDEMGTVGVAESAAKYDHEYEP
jgi:hypothetical protein